MDKTFNIAIIDYKMSNMFSIKNALDMLGFDNAITSNNNKILTADGAVLPGVGSFPEAVKHIRDLGLGDNKRFYIPGKTIYGYLSGLAVIVHQKRGI